MGLFDFAREKLTSVTEVLPTDLVDQALAAGEGITGADLGGVADAIGQGQGVQDIAADAADVVLMRPGISGVADAIVLARRAMRVIRQNLWWAFGYNLIAIPAAAGLLVPLLGWHPGAGIAAAAMACSSLAVLANSLRLRGAAA